MELPESDQDYLNQKGYQYSLIPDGDSGFLIIKDYPVSADVYDRATTDLMIRIPAQYNNAKLDNFYCDPELRMKVGGGHPDRADHFENFIERRWQRFSRHFPAWRPGVDGIPTLLTFVQRELQRTS